MQIATDITSFTCNGSYNVVPQNHRYDSAQKKAFYD